MLALRVCALALAFVSNVVLAHALGAEGLGVYAWATSIAIVLQAVAVAGFDALAVRELGAGSATRDHARMAGVLRHSRTTVSLISVVIVSLACAAAWFTLSGERLDGLIIASCAVPFLALTSLRQAAAQGLGRVVMGRVPEDLLRPLLVIGGVGGCWAAGIALSGPDALLVQNGAIVSAFLLGAWLLHTATPAAVREAEPFGSRRGWIRMALPLGAFGLSGVVLNQLGIVALGFLSDNADVAVFAVAMRLAIVVNLPEAALNSAFMPTIARLNAEGDRVALQRVASQIALAGGVACLLVATPILVVPTVPLAAFGEAGDGGETVLRLLCVAWFVNALAGTNGSLLTMSGFARPALNGTLLALSANLVLLIALVPHHGSLGAAWAWLVTVCVWNAALALSVRRRLGFFVTPWGALRRHSS